MFFLGRRWYCRWYFHEVEVEVEEEKRKMRNERGKRVQLLYIRKGRGFVHPIKYPSASTSPSPLFREGTGRTGRTGRTGCT